jgi:hypothetical protein
MSKRARITSNSTSLIPGKVHRRVFQNKYQFSNVAGTALISGTTDFSFGLDTLPRRPNFVWAAEVVKINYYIQDNQDVTASSDDWHVTFGVAVSNSTDMVTYIGTNAGIVNFVRRDEIIDASSYWGHMAGTSGMTATKDGEISHDVTDTMGQGILVFGDKLFLLYQTLKNPQNALWCCAEIFYRYREVPLEYYLSTQQDAMASGI